MEENRIETQLIAQVQNKTSVLAITSFILSLMGYVFAALIALLFSPHATAFKNLGFIVLISVGLLFAGPIMGFASIIFGGRAIRSIKKSSDREKGYGLAIASIVLGAFELCLGGIIYLLAYFY
jgi:hypothetical protein